MDASASAIQRMFESISLGAPENAIGFVFWRITARYQREMDRTLEPLGLTHLQFVSLALSAWLSRSGEETKQAELAHLGGIHPMQLSQMLKTLEDKRYISRRRSSIDSRAKHVSITRLGLSTLRQALPFAIQVQFKLFGEAGQPGGSLHKTLSEIDRSLTAQSEEL